MEVGECIGRVLKGQSLKPCMKFIEVFVELHLY